jgi:RNA polymerase sigma-70 factor (ECF subfamily)
MMQDEAPAHVLKSEAIPPSAMSETNNPTDEKLMLTFAQGSPEAFTELFHRYQQPIYGFFYRRLAEPSQAEELSQETFLVIVRSASRYEARALFRTYLYAVAFKILRAHRRKTIFRAAFFAAPASSPDPARQDSTEAALGIRRAMAKLDATDREIVLLREFEQLSYGEIAEVLQLSVNTVRSRLFRARAALRDLLEARAPQPATQTLPALGERS